MSTRSRGPPKLRTDIADRKDQTWKFNGYSDVSSGKQDLSAVD